MSRNVGGVWSLPTVLAGIVETSAFIWVSFDIFSKDPSGTVTAGGVLQMRRGLRHRLCAMAAGRRDGRGLAQRPRPPTICKMPAAVACVILSFLKVLGSLSGAKYNAI
jgi:hypothetical protein